MRDQQRRSSVTGVLLPSAAKVVKLVGLGENIVPYVSGLMQPVMSMYVSSRGRQASWWTPIRLQCIVYIGFVDSIPYTCVGW